RRDAGSRLRCDHSLVDLLNVEIAIERGRQDECVLVDVTALEFQSERGLLLLDRSGQAQSIEVLLEGRPGRLREQGTARVQELLVVLKEGLAAKLVAARLGENLDATEA